MLVVSTHRSFPKSPVIEEFSPKRPYNTFFGFQHKKLGSEKFEYTGAVCRIEIAGQSKKMNSSLEISISDILTSQQLPIKSKSRLKLSLAILCLFVTISVVGYRVLVNNGFLTGLFTKPSTSQPKTTTFKRDDKFAYVESDFELGIGGAGIVMINTNNGEILANDLDKGNVKKVGRFVSEGKPLVRQ